MTTLRIAPMSEAEAAQAAAPGEDGGLGALCTGRGNLPLDRLDAVVEITGLVSRTELTQEFVNVHEEPLEATYVFPLPDRAAVTGMRMTAGDRVVEATLQERGAAREAYDQAVAAGQQAAIAEEERPDVFTMRVGNILAGERVTVTITLVGPLAVADDEAMFRFPLVVAPRYIPGTPLPGDAVGAGYGEDTDAVPDASRITPPVLLPGFPNPVKLSIEVGIDPAGLPLGEVRSSLHTISTEDGRIRMRPGERPDRDFVLRLAYGGVAESAALTVTPDAGRGMASDDDSGADRAPEDDSDGGRGGDRDSDSDEGTYELTVLPPVGSAPPRPRDVVLLLDRSGSMEGWKMVAARRAAARIIDTLTDTDRFAVLAFDHLVEAPETLPAGLVAATDRHRFRAVEHLARMQARGATELLDPLRQALRMLAGDDDAGQRDRVIVLVTDGQVGNEDQILRSCAGEMRRVRTHTVGIDEAVNAGFLGRLASLGSGRCELVESEDRLDEAMERIHRRIGSPLVRDVRLTATGLTLVDGTRTPDRLPDLFPGVPYVVRGRYRGAPHGALALTGTTVEGRPWSASAVARRRSGAALPAIWARAALRDLEDRYVVLGARPGEADREALERQIVETSLRFGVLCRFTAYVAVASRVVTEGGRLRKIVQPVSVPAGWELFREPAPVPGGLATCGLAAPQALTFAAPMPSAMPAAGSGSFTPASPGAPTRTSGATRRAAPARWRAGRAGGRVGGRVVPVAGATAAGAGGNPATGGGRQPGGPFPEEIRAQFATEARRLREAGREPDHRRRELLEDLGSRLAALVAGDPPAFASLRELAEMLRPDRLGERSLDDLWREALRVLETLAGEAAASGGAPDGSDTDRRWDESATDRRRAFWKRGG